MKLPSFANPANLVRPEDPKQQPIPDDVTIPELAEQVVRGKVKLTPMQQRMLIELLPFYMPKLTAVGVAQLTGEEFAARLEQAIERSSGARVARLIEAQAEPEPTPEREAVVI